jgi:hypothetical protein
MSMEATRPTNAAANRADDNGAGQPAIDRARPNKCAAVASITAKAKSILVAPAGFGLSCADRPLRHDCGNRP